MLSRSVRVRKPQVYCFSDFYLSIVVSVSLPFNWILCHHLLNIFLQIVLRTCILWLCMDVMPRPSWWESYAYRARQKVSQPLARIFIFRQAMPEMFQETPFTALNTKSFTLFGPVSSVKLSSTVIYLSVLSLKPCANSKKAIAGKNTIKQACVPRMQSSNCLT